MATATLSRPKSKVSTRERKHQALNLPQLIPVKAITPDKRNPRLDAAAELDGLAGSLDTLELLNPIQVRPNGKPGCYVLIAGERRYRAALLAGWKEIPAVVRDVDDAAAAEIMVNENLHQKRLNPVEMARSIELLCRAVSNGGAGLNKRAVCRKLGKSRAWVYRQMDILKLPAEWQGRIASGEFKGLFVVGLTRYADRPDVLSALEADMAANPADWKYWADMHHRLEFVVAQLDKLADAPGVGSGEASAISNRRAADASPEVLAPIGRRSAPVDHGPVGSVGNALGGVPLAELNGEAALIRILALIDRLDSKDQIARVDAALNARDESLTAELHAARLAHRKQRSGE